MLTYRGGGGSAKGYKIKRFAKGYIFLKYVPICGVWRRRPKGAAESRSGGRRGRRQQRQQAAGRHGRGLLRASLYIAKKGGGRPARRIGSTAGRAERQAERRGRAAGGTAGGGANWSSIILLFIIIIYTIHS